MKSNTRFKKNKRGIECYNCKQPISNHDNFCSNCGQVNDEKKLSLKYYFSEFFAGIFSFDNRLWNTLVPLLLKPGKVTKEYINGQRMKYVNPFKLYLHTTIVFFLIFGLLSMLNQFKNPNTESIIKITEANEVSKPKPLMSNKRIESRMTTNIDSLFTSTKFKEIINDTTIANKVKDIRFNNLIKSYSHNLYDSLSTNYTLKMDTIKNYQKFKEVYVKHTKEKLAKEKMNYTINKNINNEEKKIFFSSFFGKNTADKINKFTSIKNKSVYKVLDSLAYEKNWRNIFLYKKTQEYKDILQNERTSQSLKNKFFSKASIMLFFMLPIFTFFLSLIYIRHKYNYTEHLIFVFNIQTVFFIILLIGLILDNFFNSYTFTLIANFIFLFYLYLALKKFYHQSSIKTFIKFFMLITIYLFISLFAIIGTGLLAVIT